MTLSNKTNELIGQQFEKIDKEGVSVFDKSRETRSHLVPSIVVRVDDKDLRKVYDSCIESIPDELVRKLIIQPYNGYHITLQWYEPEYHSVKLEKVLVKKLDEIIKKFDPPHQGELLYPIFGYYSLWAALDERSEEKLYKIREAITSQMNNANVKSGFNERRSFLSYINLARYSQKLGVDAERLKKYANIHQNIKFISIDYILADKFLSQESKLIKRWILG